MNVSDRFWSKVNIRNENECWEWLAGKSAGYGRFNFEGKNRYAHNVSYILSHGKVPCGLEVLHLCHNEGCVNPRHLKADTHLENMRDIDKAKITLDQAIKIRALYSTGNYYQIELAEMFNLSQPHISEIVREVSWRSS